MAWSRTYSPMRWEGSSMKNRVRGIPIEAGLLDAMMEPAGAKFSRNARFEQTEGFYLFYSVSTAPVFSKRSIVTSWNGQSVSIGKDSFTNGSVNALGSPQPGWAETTITSS